MTGYRDLAGADDFHRRRLVRAFVSGSGAGRHGDQPSPGRCVIGGLILAAVVLAAMMASSTLTGHPNLSWGHGLVETFR